MSAYHENPNNQAINDFISIVATFMGSLLMILLGVVYHFSVENSYKRLSQSNREKEILLQELHHRVKNNLQIILSIIQLQSDQSSEKSLFVELENRIAAIANSYEILIMNNQLQFIDMKSYIDSLLLNIQKCLSTSEQITINSKIKATTSLRESVYIGLIINELVTNAYKYAFKDKAKGEISLTFTENKGVYQLIITDNGVGFEPSSNPKSLGLELVNSLVKEQLKGSIDYSNQEGSRYTISFSKRDY
jgi:two-component sensor histidine kinase